MWPSLSRIAPEPLASPCLTTVWIDTTDFDTFAETLAQFGALPPSTVAEPEPWLFDETLLNELDVGIFTQPLVSAA